MKKWLVVLVMLPALLHAAPVDPNLAQQVALNFISASDGSTNTAHSISQQRRLRRVAKQAVDTPPYYIFNNEDGGFVIVAGDDCATPILGYSHEGFIDLDNLPIQLQELLQAYALEIQEAIDNNLQATEEVAESWAAYRRAPQSQTTTTAVSALISTTWDQYPRYNNKCPSDQSLSSLGGHPTTGCVATAMAQVMKYWGYPEKGTGSKSYRSEHYGTLSANFGITTYDWANMPLKLSSSTSSAQNDAVATLMYHCGVAVEMSYNSDGRGSSGAYVVDVGYGRASAEKALKTYFGYASTVTGKIWGQSTSTATWSNMLKTELDNQRPVLYAGYVPNGGGGHAFVCDGYDSNNKFHFNWGWGGQANGYFSLTALTPGNYNFSDGQQAVIGIKPANGASPAKTYDLYMNTDLTAVGTNSSSSSSVTNPYTFKKTLSFTAKIENNGTGIFNGSFKVGAFTDSGEFIAWSKESYHFSLGAGKVTEKQTFTFDGGVPFIPGKYRAYMYFQDDDETDCKLVKSDEGVFLTEYNNVVFNVVCSSDLMVKSSFDVTMGELTTLSAAFIDVLVKNTALLTTFRGEIRLSLYDTDGKFVTVLDSADYSTGFPAGGSEYISFYTGIIDVEPGTYYVALLYCKSGESTWYYMGCDSAYPNPAPIIIQAPTLTADEYEQNNTHTSATSIDWWPVPGDVQFGQIMATIHEDADIDYYKLSFPEANKYKVDLVLADKCNKLGFHYVNADVQFAYAIGNSSYSGYYKDKTSVTFNGPTTLYIRIKESGMNGLGQYELYGGIEETILDAIEDIHIDSNTPTKILYDGQIFIIRDGKMYTLQGQLVK